MKNIIKINKKIILSIIFFIITISFPFSCYSQELINRRVNIISETYYNDLEINRLLKVRSQLKDINQIKFLDKNLNLFNSYKKRLQNEIRFMFSFDSCSKLIKCIISDSSSFSNFKTKNDVVIGFNQPQFFYGFEDDKYNLYSSGITILIKGTIINLNEHEKYFLYNLYKKLWKKYLYDESKKFDSLKQYLCQKFYPSCQIINKSSSLKKEYIYENKQTLFLIDSCSQFVKCILNDSSNFKHETRGAPGYKTNHIIIRCQQCLYKDSPSTNRESGINSVELLIDTSTTLYSEPFIKVGLNENEKYALYKMYKQFMNNEWNLGIKQQENRDKLYRLQQLAETKKHNLEIDSIKQSFYEKVCPNK